MPSIFNFNINLEQINSITPSTLYGLSLKGIKTVSDFLLFTPINYIDKSKIQSAFDIKKEGIINTFAKVKELSYFGKENNILKITLEECFLPGEEKPNPPDINLLCFNRNYLEKFIYPGSVYYIYGKAERRWGNNVDLGTFEIHSYTQAKKHGLGQILPVYSMNSHLKHHYLVKGIKSVLDMFSSVISNDFSDEFYNKHNLLLVCDAIKTIHFPSSIDDVEKARRSLSASEIYYFLKDKITSNGRSKDIQISEYIFDDKENSLINSLEYQLTKSQIEAIRDICTDLDAPFIMNRLLQADVGAGKTIVSIISMYHQVLKGGQCVLMAPTELLALQHYSTIKEILKNTDINVDILYSGLSAKDKNICKSKITNKETDIVVATHSVLSDSIEFPDNFSFLIVDEEQRFGTIQKTKLQDKYKNVNTLYMTATPIPRSLAVAMCGEMNISVIKEKPENRIPIKTFCVNENKRAKVYQAIQKEFDRGHQAYFISPRIETHVNKIRDIYKISEELKKYYKDTPFAIIHSGISESEKVKILNDFKNGEIKYIVATSVIEVGIDNKNATCMVIDNADMFGLSTLHQLRGRVGRGDLQSWCFAIYRSDITEDSKKRLSAFHSTSDGFKLSEEDAYIRGTGDILGTKQSGDTTLVFTDMKKDLDLLSEIRNLLT